jgi:hypothetical protein
MPTGYTSCIEDGIEFKDFIMQCARAMGACISMRDEPSSKPIPEKFEPYPYHKERLETAQKEFAVLEKLTDEECEERAKQKHTKDINSDKDYINGRNELRGKYMDMLSKVQGWKPPTPDHEGLKEFMESQITGSIDFDCNTSYSLERMEKIEPMSGEEWRSMKMKSLIKDIDYHEKEWQKEVSRVEERNRWIKDLRESLEIYE